MSEYGPINAQRQQEPNLQLFKSYYYFSEIPRWKGCMRGNVHFMAELGFTARQIAEILLIPLVKVIRSLKGKGPERIEPPKKAPVKVYKRAPYGPRVKHMPREWREKL